MNVTKLLPYKDKQKNLNSKYKTIYFKKRFIFFLS